MTKHEIAQRVLKLLDCDGDELETAILNLANEIKEDYYASIEDKCYCCD
jgi:hypothetical protein